MGVKNNALNCIEGDAILKSKKIGQEWQGCRYFSFRKSGHNRQRMEDMQHSKETLKEKVITGLFWKFLERGGTQAVQFILQIILARLLLPEDYGITGLLSVFIAIASIFVQSGFGSALIQRKHIDDVDCSSVFYLNLGIAVIFYGLLFWGAPAISSFYTEPLLTPVLRVQALVLFFGAFNAVQTAILSREMAFQKSFFVSLGGILAQGSVGILLAWRGFGVWSLVFSQLANSVVSTLILWFAVRWRPRLLFSGKRLRGMFFYGSKLLLSSLIDTVFTNIYSLVIGKLYNKEMLGYYNRGLNIPSLVVTNINGSIQGVIFPALSACQEKKDQIKQMMRRSITTSSFLLFPMMMGLAAIAKPLTLLLLTEKWLPCVPFLQFSCLALAFYPIHTANLQAINAIGRSDIFLKLELVKKGITVAALLATIPFGIYAMMIGRVVTSLIGTLVNAWPNRSLLGYSFREQWKDILPSFLLSLAMGGLVWGIGQIPLPVWLTLLIQITIGAAFYLAAAKAFRLECFRYLTELLRDYWDRWKQREKGEKSRES